MAEPARQPQPTEPAKATQVAPIRKKTKALRAYLVLAALAGAAIAVYYVHGYLTRDEVSTDDAQVDADVVPVAARVGGAVVKMSVEDNQHVEANTVIAELDSADYEARLAAAEADLEAAREQAQGADEQVEITKSTSAGGLSSAKAQLAGTGASVRSAAAQVAMAKAQVERAQAELEKADSDYNRAKTLHDQGAVSGAQLENAQVARASARAAVDTAKASLVGARDQEAQAQSRVAEAAGHVEESTTGDRKVASAAAAARTAHTRVASAEQAVKLAQIALDNTKIHAPVTGYASRLAVHVGQLLQPGSLVLMVVPEKTYVIANFKETQIERIRPGDPVDISVDALGKALHGKVVSVSPGTGARFSMMPPDNSTGNFVKVVQRVPVKIAIDEKQPIDGLHAGLSAEVTVHLQH